MLSDHRTDQLAAAVRETEDDPTRGYDPLDDLPGEPCDCFDVDVADQIVHADGCPNSGGF